ncbi:Ubiquitin/SUMO-activating enzyme E1 [Penicillium bovifimosum]|uniref:Ubiquitin-like 1-activating enzyme E1A n=1 Tax=Penicillium bovifimosum TaxID=126998 RepID=A0A9W9L9S6_9EURO|nr:Ubiquitin/SUMO-activating enzyme E1 [Penicillium bovifimosum]KAJ5144198.1 Ubiquitin/SUMO-activating enzyme E1 [Penicillium bovifimosum]
MAEQQDNAQSISADEIALYDRQIRLWGVQAQEKIRSANICLITVKALANEVAKNLVLAGIGSLTIIDHQHVTEEDLGAQFFVAEALSEQEVIGKNRAQVAGPQIHKMNPRVKLHIDTSDVKTKEYEFFAQFDIIIATELDFNTNTIVNAACRLANRPFYAAGLHGFYGYAFADLIQHEFVIERSKSNMTTATQETPTRTVINITTKEEQSKTKEPNKIIELVTNKHFPLPEDYTRLPRRRKQVTPLLSCLRALWEFEKLLGRRPTFTHEDLELFTKLSRDRHQELKLEPLTLDSVFLRTFLQNLGSELSPVAAFLGGSVAQDVINVLSAREQPLQNMLLFDGEKSIGPIYPLHPFFPDRTELAAVPPVRNPVTVPLTEMGQ